MSAESNSPEPPLPTREDSFDVSAEDRPASSPASAPRDTPPAPQPPACLRRTARQGTSYMAFRHEPLAPDDPLLGFRPVPHKAPRRNSITPARQRAFIAALAEGGIVKDAARSIGASMEALYKLRHKPGAEEFAAAWEAAIDRGIARLEDSALARAIQGEERVVVSGGEVVAVERRHNEALVMFFLRNRRGERYAPDARTIRPGHPLYEAIRAEVAAEYEAKLRQREQECALRERKFERQYEERLEMLDRHEEEWAEEQQRLAEEEEAAKTPEERSRDALIYAMRHWSLEELQDRVDW